MSSCRTKVVYERLRSIGEMRSGGGGFRCVQPLATRGDGAGVPPPRGKAGGAACCSCMAAEKDGLVEKSSSSADNCSRLFVVVGGGGVSGRIRVEGLSSEDMHRRIDGDVRGGLHVNHESRRRV